MGAYYAYGRDFERLLCDRLQFCGISVVSREPDTRLPNGATPDFLVQYNGARCCVESMAFESTFYEIIELARSIHDNYTRYLIDWKFSAHGKRVDIGAVNAEVFRHDVENWLSSSIDKLPDAKIKNGPWWILCKTFQFGDVSVRAKVLSRMETPGSGRLVIQHMEDPPKKPRSVQFVINKKVAKYSNDAEALGNDSLGIVVNDCSDAMLTYPHPSDAMSPKSVRHMLEYFSNERGWTHLIGIWRFENARVGDADASADFYVNRFYAGDAGSIVDAFRADPNTKVHL